MRVDAGGDFARIVASYTAQAGEARLSAPLLAVFDSAAGGAHRGALAERVAWLSRLSRFDRDVVRPIENESLVTGHDLTEIGISPGPEMGRILEAIRVERIAGAIATREEALAFAREASATGG
ncbi:hypothetical protein K8I61_10125 [bacterium]|nr:hypothetical protein [bacterium]